MTEYRECLHMALRARLFENDRAAANRWLYEAMQARREYLHGPLPWLFLFRGASYGKL